jgi:hypothetical protein
MNPKRRIMIVNTVANTGRRILNSDIFIGRWYY